MLAFCIRLCDQPNRVDVLSTLQASTFPALLHQGHCLINYIWKIIKKQLSDGGIFDLI